MLTLDTVPASVAKEGFTFITSMPSQKPYAKNLCGFTPLQRTLLQLKKIEKNCISKDGRERFLGIFAVDLMSISLTLSIFDRSGYAAEASSCFDLAMGMDGSFPCSRSPTWTIPGLQQRSKRTPSAMKHWSVNPWWLWTCQILLWAAATQETQSNQLTGAAPRLEINKNWQICQASPSPASAPNGIFAAFREASSIKSQISPHTTCDLKAETTCGTLNNVLICMIDLQYIECIYCTFMWSNSW